MEDAVLDRDLHIVEEDVVDLMTALKGGDAAHSDAGALHVDEQEGDARLRLGVGIGADQEEAPVGVLAERGPGLLAVDDVVFLAVIAGDAFGAGLQAREVGAGTGLGIPLAPPVDSVADTGEEALLLLLGPEGIEDRRQHGDAKGQNTEGVGPGLLLGPDVFLGRRPAGSAQLDRPGRRGPALLGEDPVPGEIVLLAQGFPPLLFLPQIPRIVFCKESPNFIAECSVFGGKIQVHD